MNIEQVVAEMPKAENPHEAFKDVLKRITPLTELGDVSNLRLKSLTTMEEALDSSNLSCASARWGAFDDGSSARAKLLAEQGYRPVPSEDAISARILSLILEYNNIPLEHKADENLAIWIGWRLHRWWLEGE